MPRAQQKTGPGKHDRVVEGAVPAELLAGAFPSLDLPIKPPFPPMGAKSVREIPAGDGWLYEPKWDGFRCLVFRSGDTVALQSKAGQPLGRYFPELVNAFQKLPAQHFVLDGEIVIVREGHLSFDDLLLRIHPASSRIRKLSLETPASFLAFDLLVEDIGAGKVEGSTSFVSQPLSERRRHLQSFFRRIPKGAPIHLSPASTDRDTAERWMTELAGSGFDGVIAKRLDGPYACGERAMEKIKRLRTADCVVGGFRWASKGGEVGSLLLGLYGDDGLLHHVGFTSSFSIEQRKELKRILKPHIGGSGFTGHAPGGPSRWSTERSGEWERLKPKLVCEVQYDYFSGGRFRHGTKFLRWRSEKAAQQCTYEQVEACGAQLGEVLRAA
jgi:ATP-dependent DNA ligase